VTSSTEHLLSEWHSSRNGAFLWTQHLCGEVVEYLGAAHGFAGNAHALLRAAPLLSAARRADLYQRCAETAAKTATVEGALANWPPVAGEPGRSNWLVQWCHGAPGVVVGLAAVPLGFDGRLDALLAAGGELIWQAGPLENGCGLCHGSAGNGYAFLKLYRRTGDAKWLERARSFAMHAIAQSARMRARYGRGRYTLWTGDPGLAVYLWDCVRAEGEVPFLDVV
jgi:lantibiotic modifying enzyme